MKSLSMKLETITPKKAAEYLKRNKNNRPLGSVNNLVGVLERGEWKVNGDPIRFNGEDLIDGQNRLTAVTRTGITIKSYVLRGLDKDVYDTLDQGKRRNLCDALARDGKRHYTSLASAARWLKCLENGYQSIWGLSGDSLKVLHDFAISRPELEPSVEFIMTMRKEMQFPGGLFAALHCVFSKAGRELADEFFHRVVEGVGLSKEMPEHLLRKTLVNVSPLRKLRPESVAILVIKAWNARISNRTIKCLKVIHGEVRPNILLTCEE